MKLTRDETSRDSEGQNPSAGVSEVQDICMFIDGSGMKLTTNQHSYSADVVGDRGVKFNQCVRIGPF